MKDVARYKRLREWCVQNKMLDLLMTLMGLGYDVRDGALVSPLSPR